MTKLIVFWGLFAAVLLGIVATIFRNRRLNREAQRKTEEALRRAEEALQQNLEERRRRREGAAEPSPAAPAGKAVPSFDAAATRMYARSDVVADPKAVADRPGARATGAGTPQLICLGGPNRGRHYPVPAIGLAIGRADDNDLVIVDGRISAHHAWIGVVEGRVLLRDYQSLNGTFLNADMDAPVSEVALVDGDTIFFGGHGGDQYRFVIG